MFMVHSKFGSSVKYIGILVLLLAVLLGKGVSGGSVPARATGIHDTQGSSGAPVGHTYGSNTLNPNRPVLAFYYMWYTPQTWCLCHMSDLPTTHYFSTDDATIGRQVSQAANAGITGFISSWWGQGSMTDHNFARLLAHSATLEQTTGQHFA